MAKALKFDLSDLAQRPEFLRELGRAAQLTIDHPGEESMFVAYADEHYHAAFVNEAVLGIKIPVFHSPELSELVAPEGAIAQERMQDPKASLDVAYEPGKGGYLPQGAYMLISTHFHPVGSDLRPSRPDLLSLLAARKVNYNLREMNGDLDELEDEKEIEISDIEEEDGFVDPDDYRPAAYLYANPVEVIGLARGNSGSIDLVVYQSITEHPIEPEEFDAHMAKALKRRFNADFEPQNPFDLHYPYPFKSFHEYVDFLNGTERFRVVPMSYENGAIRTEDAEKLRQFQLIEEW